MKTRSLILVGLLSFAFFVVALFPASLVWRLAGGALSGLPVTVEQVGGTVWSGFLQTRVQAPVPGPLLIHWDLKGLRLLMGELALNLRLEGAQYRLEGNGFWGLWGKGVADVNGDVQAALLEQVLNQYDISAQGAIKVNEISAKLSGQRVVSAGGDISWSGGQVAVRSGSSPQNIDFPGVKGELAAVEGNLILAVTETRTNKPLGELSLLPEQGLAGVKVLKRVLSLAGFGGEGDEDKTLLSLQQPLPF
ncbi:MAG: type II secretion system protein GspN [Gammaproteobacteria bacterium]|nr:type II secretion system protein GspN [Gammaproteobacteria bacterium]